MAGARGVVPTSGAGTATGVVAGAAGAGAGGACAARFADAALNCLSCAPRGFGVSLVEAVVPLPPGGGANTVLITAVTKKNFYVHEVN